MTQTIVVAKGNGIGPEISDTVLAILQAAKVPLAYEFIEVGEDVYRSGNTSGVSEESWEKIKTHRIILKGPITTPQGGGYKSINVTFRRALGLYANVRPCRAYTPFVPSHFPQMDLVIIRENEEDLYTGIEYQVSQEELQCLKVISRTGCEQIVRYAFEYARTYERKKITCMTKDNIMKLTDGSFRKIFEEVGSEYPKIQKEHLIIDIGAARIAARPESFDVIVTLNLYGDIISDIAAEVAGSVGLAGSANIGKDAAMFEAIHGSAPDIAGKGIANPSGLLLAAAQMLVHLGQSTHAELIQNAWLKTLEDGIHTADIFREKTSTKKVSTNEFGQAVIERLGKMPEKLSPVKFHPGGINVALKEFTKKKAELVGADIFLSWDKEGRNPEKLGAALQTLSTSALKLKMISNRGMLVYPGAQSILNCSDSWRCRFVADGYKQTTFSEILKLLNKISEMGFEISKIENLALYDGKPSFSLAQGE